MYPYRFDSFDNENAEEPLNIDSAERPAPPVPPRFDGGGRPQTPPRQAAPPTPPRQSAPPIPPRQAAPPTPPRQATPPTPPRQAAPPTPPRQAAPPPRQAVPPTPPRQAVPPPRDERRPAAPPPFPAPEPPSQRPPGRTQRPTGAPPRYVPQKGPQLRAVDPGAIQGCLFRFTYVWLTSGRAFWFYPIFVGRQSVAGYRWSPFGWTYMGMDLNSIESFSCRV